HTRSKRDWSSDVCSSDLLTSFRPALVVGLMPASDWKSCTPPPWLFRVAVPSSTSLPLSFSMTVPALFSLPVRTLSAEPARVTKRSEEHTSELQSRFDLVC